MTLCSNCKLKKSRWSSVHGFNIGKKTYCCFGCGFSGCTCLPPPKRKILPAPTPSR